MSPPPENASSPDPGPGPKRFRIVVAYDGRPYCGWQSQADGGTVQDILIAACREICPEISTVQGAGRTDSGVSAEGQVAHFDTPDHWGMGAEQWIRALNTKLPTTIRVMCCETVPQSFHARFSASRKTYRYRLFTGPVLPPLLAGLAWHRRGTFSTEVFAERLALFEGEHDFASFSANRKDGHDEVRSTVRRIFEASVESPEPEHFEFRFRGNGFLYKMVRFLVGSTVYGIERGLGSEEVRALLAGKRGGLKAPYCAPADGLTLERVVYESD